MNIIKLNTIGDIVKRVEGGSAPIANQSKEVVITENGTTIIKPDAGYTGLGSVKIVVALPIDVSNYLTIEALEDDLKVSLDQDCSGLMYCIDGSGIWQRLGAGATSASINAGQTISFKSAYDTFYSGSVGLFKISKRCNVLGNIMSLLYEDMAKANPFFDGEVRLNIFARNDTIIDASRLVLPARKMVESCYYGMFEGCTNLISAPPLPATELAYGCYSNMFSGCSSLVEAPVLPATELGEAYYCYHFMFNGCSKLSYVKAMFNDIPTSHTGGWLSGVSPTGTFVKSAAATWDVTGSNGVPIGWTVETATE